MSAGIAEIQSRVAAIQSRIAVISGQGAPMAAVGTSSTAKTTSTYANMSSTDFAHELQNASALQAAGSSPQGDAGLTTGDAVVSDAKRYLGVPYVWGGTDPATGLDCSGLVQRVYKDLGINLPRVSQDQAKSGTPVASLADARPGDLLVFHDDASHIAIYAGNNQMVEAPRPGLQVRLTTVTETPTAIRRVLPSATPPASSSLDLTGRPSRASAYQSLFDAATAKYGLPRGILSAVAKAESGYDARARSSAGAVGLMQIMPSTAAGLGVDPTDPVQAVDGAARILSGNLRKFGSVPLALAAYNAGGGAVSRYGGIPPFAETQSYVRKVQTFMQELS